MRKQQVFILNKNKNYKVPHKKLEQQVLKIFSFLSLEKCQIDITFVDDDFMKIQNKKFMGKSSTTDVLSFPLLQPPQKLGDASYFEGKFLGDILISLDQANKQAQQQNILLKQEVLFLVIHSILHLLGYDHDTKKNTKQMQSLESLIWKTFI